MLHYENTYCITYAELISSTGISEANYKYMKGAGKIDVVRRGCNATPSLINFESLPEKLKEAVIQAIGNPYKKLHISVLQQSIEPDAKARLYFDSYKLEDGRLLPSAVREEYYTNAIVMNAVHTVMNNKALRRQAMGARKTNQWPKISESVNELDRERYPHSLPSNERRLRDKVTTYVKEGYESLIHKSYCNKYAAKVDDEVKESVLNTFFADPRNLDNEQIRAVYNQIAENMGWKMITRQAVAVWREKYELVTYAGRRGATQLKANKSMQVKRSRPTQPLYYWTADGWDAELLYQKVKTDAKGNNTTTYHNRLTIVVVLDPCVNYPIGYAIGDHESPELITEAFRNAADHTRELWGRRYRAHQLQTDNYARKALTPMYTGVAEKFTPAEVKNAKAKVIEPYFKSLNKKYCQLMPNWSGFGVTSKKENQPNTDALNKYKKNFPDEEGCRHQLDFIIAKERAAKYEQYMKLWETMEEDDKLELNDEIYLSLFGRKTERTIMMEATGLRPMLLGQRREYDSFDISFRKHASTRWIVKYNPDDLSSILAENEDGSIRYVLTEKYVQPMALKDRKEGDYKQLEAVREYNSSLYEHITEVRALADGTTHELLEDPRLKDTLAKHLLVDSRGQHKNYLKQKTSPPALSQGDGAKKIGTNEEDDDEELNLFEIM